MDMLWQGINQPASQQIGTVCVFVMLMRICHLSHLPIHQHLCVHPLSADIMDMDYLVMPYTRKVCDV